MQCNLHTLHEKWRGITSHEHSHVISSEEGNLSDASSTTGWESKDLKPRYHIMLVSSTSEHDFSADCFFHRVILQATAS